MLEFSDAPYQFFPAQPSRLVMGLIRQLNNCYILKNANHRIAERVIEGELDAVKQLHKDGKRILLVANHPSHSDPQFMFEVQRQLGIPAAFMAAYDAFLRGKLQAWFMQKNACFSIDREGSDRKAMSEAIDILKQGDYALTIFPEGNVYLMNDRVTPFLDGTSFIALKAHQALKGESEVYIVPVSFKFSQLTDTQDKVDERLTQLAQDSGFKGEIDTKDPGQAVVSIACHLLSTRLKEKSDLDITLDLTDLTPEQTRDRLHELTRDLASGLEADLELPVDNETFIVDRIRKIRSKIHQLKTEDTDAKNDNIDALADRAILTFRILAYVLPYFNEKPSLDRYSEIVERLCEDFYSKSFQPLGPRKAMAQIGKPISVADMLGEGRVKAREVLPKMTRAMEESIQQGIDQLNSNLDSPGSKEIIEKG